MRNSTTGTGILVLGIVLAAVGAILAFAVTTQASGFNIHEVGDIIFIVGIVTFVISLFIVVSGGYRRSTIREDVQMTAGGESRVVQREDRLS